MPFFYIVESTISLKKNNCKMLFCTFEQMVHSENAWKSASDAIFYRFIQKTIFVKDK